MASIRIVTKAAAADVWSALRDIGAVHTLLVPDMVRAQYSTRERIVPGTPSNSALRPLVVDRPGVSTSMTT